MRGHHRWRSDLWYGCQWQCDRGQLLRHRCLRHRGLRQYGRCLHQQRPGQHRGAGQCHLGQRRRRHPGFGNEARETVIQSNIIGLNASATANLSGLVNPRSDASATARRPTHDRGRGDRSGASYDRRRQSDLGQLHWRSSIIFNATIITSVDVTVAPCSPTSAGWLRALGVRRAPSVLKSNVIGVLPASPTPPNSYPSRKTEPTACEQCHRGLRPRFRPAT